MPGFKLNHVSKRSPWRHWIRMELDCLNLTLIYIQLTCTPSLTLHTIVYNGFANKMVAVNVSKGLLVAGSKNKKKK